MQSLESECNRFSNRTRVMRRSLRREVFHHFYDGGTGFFARAHVFYAMESADVPTLRVLLEARAKKEEKGTNCCW